MGILIMILSALGALIAGKLAVGGLVHGSISLSRSVEFTGLVARVLGIISLVVALGLGAIAVGFAYAAIKLLSP